MDQSTIAIPCADDSLPDEIADAWAAVFIDVFEKQREPEEEHVEYRAAG